MDLRKEIFVIQARSQSVLDWQREQEMLISMERERRAKRFPWKRKGYRKHIR